MPPKEPSFSRLELSEERRDGLSSRLGRLMQEEYGEELSPFRANTLIEFFLGELGPPVYNQAIQDARGFIQERLDDLDADFYAPDAD